MSEKQRTVLNSQSREQIVRLRSYFERERQNGGPLLPVEEVCNRVADALDVSKRTIIRVTKEKLGGSGMEENKLSTPNKKREKKCTQTEADSFDVDAIRNHIYRIYAENEIPTLKKLNNTLKETGLFHGSETSLWRLLRKIGFRYKKCDKRKIVMERSDIVLARCSFLRATKNIEDWDNVVFIDETWLNANHTVGKIWTDDTAHCSTKPPSGKGQRLIICHAGSSKGFVSNCLLAFKSTKTGDYHEEMDFKKFKEWFVILLQNLQEPSTIIMDNAPYHSVQKNKPPTKNNNKSEIVEWLQANNIVADVSMLKVELMQLVEMHKPPQKYIIDEMAKEAGHTVIRLPPYHCQYNAIEMIWAQVKGYAARHNTSPPFTANKMMNLLKEACGKITPDDWKNVVEKTKKIIADDWDRDVQFDNMLENNLIINLQSSSSDDESTDDEMPLPRQLF